MKIRMIEMTTAPVVDLPTPAAPPRVRRALIGADHRDDHGEDEGLEQAFDHVVDSRSAGAPTR